MSLAHSPRLIVLFALIALVAGWITLTWMSRHEPWYQNANENLHRIVDALAINSGEAPRTVEQPGFTPSYLLALDYRLRHAMGLLPVWNFATLAASSAPLAEIHQLVYLSRIHNQLLMFAAILTAAALAYAIFRTVESAALVVLCLCGCTGLAYQGLVARPELLGAWLGCLSASFCLWQARHLARGGGHHGWLFATGLLIGLATLSHLPAIGYLVGALIYCWSLRLLPAKESAEAASANLIPLSRWTLPILSSLTLLWLLSRIASSGQPLTTTASLRLQLLAVVTGSLPLLMWCKNRASSSSLITACCHELALLLGGLLAALCLGYGSLLAIMPSATACGYFSHLLNAIAAPAPFLRIFLAGSADSARELAFYFKDTPFLLLGSIAATVAVCFTHTVGRPVKDFLCLLLFQALLLTVLMSRGNFHAGYTVYLQAPLLVLLALAFSALPLGQKRSSHWAVPPVLTAALLLALTVSLRLYPRHAAHRSESSPPLSGTTVTFLYDHDAHPPGYLKLMQAKYSSREKFTAALNVYLHDSAKSPAEK